MNKKLSFIAKLFAFILVGFIGLASFFSCDEKVDPDDPNNEQTEIEITAQIADWASIKLMPDGTPVNMSKDLAPKWEKGNRIFGYYNNGTNDVLMTYEVDEVAEDGKASFKKIGKFEEPKKGETAYFVYASNCEVTDISNGKLQVNIQNQTKSILPLVMTASGKVVDGKLALSFKSEMAVIGIKNPSLDGSQNIDITELTLSGTRLVVDGSLDLKTGKFTPGTEPSYITVIYDQGISSEEMIFVSVFPEITTDLKLTITIQEAFEYLLTCESLTFKANSLYYFNAPDFTRAAGYVPIDWEKDVSSKTFDAASGNLDITFKTDVPPLKKHDVLTVPDNAGDYHIRVVSSAVQTKSGGTLSIKTTEGKMGHLFKNRKFTLSTESGASTQSPFNRVYTPSKIEIFDGYRYIPVYNSTLMGSGSMSYDFFKWEKNMDGTPLWDEGPLDLSWEQCNFEIGLKGIFEFDFGEKEWEDASIGDLQNLIIYLEGGFNMNLMLKAVATASAEFKKEITLKEEIVSARFTFMVGAVPVYISVSSDLMAEFSAEAEGEVSISGGVGAEMTAKLGVEWTKGVGGKPIYEVTKGLQMLGPEVEAKAHVEAGVYTYPSIEIALYSVLCPTINPKPYVKAGADARLVEQRYFGWNAGISTGIDLELELNLDVFFTEIELVEIDPINLFDLPIVALPDALDLVTDTPTKMKVGETQDVEFHAVHKNYLTGTQYNGKGLLVHFEAEGGTIDKEYAYTDAEGNVKVSFKSTDPKGGNVKAEIILGDEEGDAVEAEKWEAEIINYRLTANPSSQIIDETGKAPISFKLEQYTSLTGEWSPAPGKTLSFTAVGGTCPSSGVTSSAGTVDIVFTAEPEFVEGSVTAEFSTSEPIVWSGSVKAEITAEEEDDSSEGQIRKAKRLGENVVRIGSELVEVVKGEMDGVYVEEFNNGDLKIMWCKEKYPELYTIHYGYLSRFSEAMLGQMIDMTNPMWGNIYLGFIHFTNTESGSYEDWGTISFQTGVKNNIVSGVVLFSRVEPVLMTKSPTEDDYTLQFYFKNTDGIEMWGNLKTARYVPEQ